MKDGSIFLYREHLKEKGVDLSHYKYVRAYHACRPCDLNSYLSDGLRPYSKEQAWNEVHKKLSGYFSEDKISSVFEKRWAEHSKDGYDAFIHLSLEKKPLYNAYRPEMQHYLIYGSEFVYSVAISLFENNWALREIMQSGIPTIITCNVPIERIPVGWHKFGFHYIDGLRALPLSKDCIVKIEHPKVSVFDPILCCHTQL